MNTDPGHIAISDYHYELPDEQVAKYPLEKRDESKLLVYKDGNISEHIFKHLAEKIPSNALLVFNNSKVIEARLLFQKPTGGVIEIFALEPHEQYADITIAMNTTGSILYKCLVGGAGKWKRGMTLEKAIKHGEEIINLSAKIAERRPDCFVIELKWTPTDISFASILHLAGNIPIPPYLHREVEESDSERYQTIYAKENGSVAAPTAGLHFTPAVMQSLTQKNIGQAFVTLHVGAGTFMPVKTSTMQDHPMHAEFIDVSISFIAQLLTQSFIIPVGTTSMRTLESLYWMGVKAYRNPNIDLSSIAILQWQAYELDKETSIEKNEALEALISWMKRNKMQSLIVKTQILIAPGYRFRIANAIITNFHQPQSTLLLLISAFIGSDWRRVYDYALSHQFRFLSYGDSCLLFANTSD